MHCRGVAALQPLLLLLLAPISIAAHKPAAEIAAETGVCGTFDTYCAFEPAVLAGDLGDVGAQDADEEDALHAHVGFLQKLLQLRRDELTQGSSDGDQAVASATLDITASRKEDGPELAQPGDKPPPVQPVRDAALSRLSNLLAGRMMPVLNGDVPKRVNAEKFDPMRELNGTSLRTVRGLSSLKVESLTAMSFKDFKDLSLFASGRFSDPLSGLLSLEQPNVSNPTIRAKDVAVVMLIAGTVNSSSRQLVSLDSVEVQLDYVSVKPHCPAGEEDEEALCKVLGLARLRDEEERIMKRLGQTLADISQDELAQLLPLNVSTDSDGDKLAPREYTPDTSHTTEIRIINKEFSDGVVFCRGPVPGSMREVYLDEGLTMPAPGSHLDCSVQGSEVARQWGEGVPQGTTLAIGLLKGESKSLYLPGHATWPSASCWFQDALSNKRMSLAKGPRYQSQVEWTIQPSGMGNVWFDLSSVEGVSGGIRMSYTDADGNQESAQAIPGKPSSLPIVQAPEVGFPVILAEKHVHGTCDCTTFFPASSSCNTAACYAACPGPLVENPCGQHRCRSWYAKKYEDKRSYCGWLYAEGAQTYCWAMDEWVCVDGDCGYGGYDQPKADCSSPLPLGAPANTYSCGHFMNQPDGSGGKYWTKGVGCQDKRVRGVPTNPAPRRKGGFIQVEFSNLPWLHQ